MSHAATVDVSGSDGALRHALREVVSQDARSVLRIAAPSFALLLSIEAGAHLITSERGMSMAAVPMALAACSAVLAWSIWFRPEAIRRPEWMVLVPWAGVVISVIQHMTRGLDAGSVIFLVATLIGVGPLVLATWPTVIAVTCTATLLAYGCYGVFDQLPWLYPLLLTPISLIMRASRREAIYEAERRRRLEQVLATQAADVESLRRLRSVTAGVAHHFNNLLAVLIGRISVAREETAPGSDVDLDLEAAQQAAERAAKLVRDLLAASRPEQTERRRALAIGEVLGDLVGPPAAGVELYWEAEDPLPLVWGDLERLRRAVQHVLDNAVEAGAREIAVRVRAPREDEQPVRLIVEDDGPGIAEQDLARVFDPFFTTRGPQRTGLGLAFARAAVEGAGGSLRLTNRPAGGLRVQFDLAPVEPSHARVDALRSTPSTQRG